MPLLPELQHLLRFLVFGEEEENPVKVLRQNQRVVEAWLQREKQWKALADLPPNLAKTFYVLNAVGTAKCKHRQGVPWFQGGWGPCMAHGCLYRADPVSTKRLDRAHVRLLLGDTSFNHIVLLCRKHNLQKGAAVHLDQERAHVFAVPECTCGSPPKFFSV